ncbi:S1C family serine protease [Myxosarcina sp. GI1]|uniref:S1C family serine protease n=1 Tax=Myxosarcina sp. GI1 TaxID=1541065 RepID=UPI0005637DCB|nr:trypsin-like peptidase domain-containing protein [Myxosarcina sp. GI1]
MIVRQIETELVAIARQLRSLTVEIASYRSGGSGVIWSREGLIVTNAHVVSGSKIDIKLEDERVIKGLVIALDNRRDLAAIEIQDRKLPIPTIGNSQLLRSGEIVLAMGNPWGFKGALTVGIIHATKWQKTDSTQVPRRMKTNLNPSYPTPLIAADLQLAPGNSGGILANAKGEIIGINMAVANGLALAIPSQQVEDFVRSIPR